MSKRPEHGITPLTDIVNAVGDLDAFRRAVSFRRGKFNPSSKEDVFTFVRVQYDAYGPFGWWDRWDNDYPDGDLNFSFRLQQLTSLRVAPDGKVLRLTDPELFDYPFIYWPVCNG